MRPDLPSLLGLARSLAIYYGAPWRRRALRRFYAGLAGPGDLVFDIGAHVGNRARALRSLGAHVVAVEPQPAFADFLALTLEGRRVRLVRQAVGRREGRAALRISRRHPTVSTLSGEWIGRVGRTAGFTKVRWDREIEVPVTTLDRLIQEFGAPAFCKIDVEGLEAEILHGLSQPLPLIAFEYLPAALPIAEECFQRLASLGRYRFNLAVGETHRMHLAEWVEADAIRSAVREAAADGRSGDVYARLGI